jgi:uncharacterized paraquat-inducible protein A
MADAPAKKLMIRCRNCHYSIVVDPSRLLEPEDGTCPRCGYRNVFGVDAPANRPLYPRR